MDYYHLREWRNKHQSDHSPASAKIPRLLLEPPHQEASESSALPLFVPEPSSRISSNLSAFTDSTTTTSRVSRMIGLFSIAQWQELELQALIFKYMLAGAAIPSELLQPIKKSLFNTSPPPCHLHHPLQQFQHYQPAMLQSGYWGRTAVDPEPGRCRRTDGKKWRCSRDVVAGQKYCERHMHRGRNRSRKPVEIPTRPTNTVTIAAAGGGGGLNTTTTTTTTTIPSVAALPITTAIASNGGNHFVLSGGGSSSSPSMDLLHLNQRYPESEPRNSEGRLDGQVLRHFFDDWPKKSQQQQQQQHTNTNGGLDSNPDRTSSTSLSISIEGGSGDHHYHHPSSDFSLKLSTGIVVRDNESGRSSREGNNKGGIERSQLMNWGMSMGGGPLAEALRSSSTSHSSSPTSVLPPPPHGSGSESSSVVTK
ncbi:WRC [Macleaya cordata]|uniref:Growth-regulating factor n=1 Tax=Macleaya cordata TaxID=56857 RepID=A0A200Q646_MACCD|nr:WRC [Macleaya cordata]